MKKPLTARTVRGRNRVYLLCELYFDQKFDQVIVRQKMDLEKATRDSWKINPLPEARKALNVQKTYSLGEFARIESGLIPLEMEQKWFIFFEDRWLYLHRSWTGYCIFKVRFSPKRDQYEIAEVWANRDSEQYTQTDDKADAELLLILIDQLIRHQL